MFFSKYLYEKIKESNSEYVSAILEENELVFLDNNNIHYKKSGLYYIINSNELKALYCN